MGVLNILTNFISIDIETTGFNYYKDKIIEISAYKFENSKPIDSFVQLINPGEKISNFISNLTSITNEDLEHSPSIKDIEDTFFYFIENLPLVFHNAQFDTAFLNQKLKKRITNDILDTLLLFRIANPFLSSYKLQRLANLFDLQGEHYHRASTDALITGELYLKLPHIFANYSKNTIKNLKQYANNKTYIQFFNQILTNLNLFEKNKIPIKIENNYNILEKKNKQSKIFFPEDNLFDENGVLFKQIKNYEIRNNQQKFAQTIYETLTDTKFGIIEAGTGTGKTFGYLIPTISLAIKNNDKFIISTKTKALQEQLFYKDLPTLHKIFNESFSAILLKGKTNYLCLKKLQMIHDIIKENINADDTLYLLPVFTFMEKSLTGDISSVSNADSKNLIKRYLTADQYSCNADKCDLADKCYWYTLKKQTKKTNIIITNHYLLSSEIKKKGKIFNEIKNIIIDEAHQFYEINIKNLGSSFTSKDIEYLMKIFTGASKNSVINTIIADLSLINSEKNIKEIQQLKTKLTNKTKLLTEEIKLIFQYVKNIINISNPYNNININKLPLKQEIINIYIQKINTIAEEIFILLDEIKTYIPIDKNYIELKLFNIEMLIKEITNFFNNFFQSKDINIVNWIHSNKKIISFHTTPLNIDKELNDNFYNKIEHIIFISATLSINKNFKYFKSTIGIPEEEEKITEKILPSEFDYQNQLYFILPSYLPLPDDNHFPQKSADLVLKLINKFKKNILILFTSYNMLNKFKKILNTDKTFNLFIQSINSSPTTIINNFKQNKGSILLGTDTLWQGIDLPNDELEILIIPKLPFNVPTDPIIEGKLNLIQSQNKNPFNYFYLPEAILKLKQGFGRLIRTKNDIGVVLLLDKRILKPYGKYIINSLPSTPEIITEEKDLLNKINIFF